MLKNFNWNRLLSILGFIVFFISLIILSNAFKQREMNENPIKVTVEIIESPSDCSKITTRGGYCKLKYKGKVYVKRAGNKFCHLVSGKDTVVVLTNKSQDKLLFVDEYDSNQFIYGIFIMIVSIVIVIKGFRN